MPPSRTAEAFVQITLMPTVSAACGCSPTERTRSPQMVRYSRNHTSGTAAMPR